MRSVVAVKCEDLDWSPVQSAASHSQLAGVIASLLFAGMIVLLTDRGKTIRHTNALILLTSSFFILALDSFLFSVIAGEQECGRAWTSTMIAGGMLGVGAIGIFGGLSWLMTAYGDGNSHGAFLTIIIAFVTAFVVGLHVWVTGLDFSRDMTNVGEVPDWLSPFVTTYAIATALGILGLAARWIAAVLRQQIGQPPRRRVTQAAYATIIYGATCSVASGVLLGPAVSDWAAVPTWAVSVAMVVPLTMVAAAMATQLLALPIPAHGRNESRPRRQRRAAHKIYSHGRTRRRYVL